MRYNPLILHSMSLNIDRYYFFNHLIKLILLIQSKLCSKLNQRIYQMQEIADNKDAGIRIDADGTRKYIYTAGGHSSSKSIASDGHRSSERFVEIVNASNTCDNNNRTEDLSNESFQLPRDQRHFLNSFESYWVCDVCNTPNDVNKQLCHSCSNPNTFSAIPLPQNTHGLMKMTSSPFVPNQGLGLFAADTKHDEIEWESGSSIEDNVDEPIFSSNKTDITAAVDDSGNGQLLFERIANVQEPIKGLLNSPIVDDGYSAFLPQISHSIDSEIVGSTVKLVLTSRQSSTHIATINEEIKPFQDQPSPITSPVIIVHGSSVAVGSSERASNTALIQAIATASSINDWAGREVQRVLKTHFRELDNKLEANSGIITFLLILFVFRTMHWANNLSVIFLRRLVIVCGRPQT